jgi:signal transduction histidine kinase
MNPLTRLPIRFAVPAILGMAALALMAAQTFAMLHEADLEVERNSAIVAIQDMTEWQTALEHLLERNEPEPIQAMLSSLGSNWNVVAALVCDERGTVLFSTRPDWIGEPASRVASGIDGAPFDSVAARFSPRTTLSADRLSLYLCLPLVLGAPGSDLRRSRIGVLWSHYDLSRRKAIRRTEIEKAGLTNGAGILVVFSVLGGVLATVVSTRLRRLEASARRFAGGDLSVRAGIAGGDEIARIGATFDEMAERIAKDRETLEERVAQRTAELTAANRELESFSYSVSHDLRAPIRGIDGFAAMLERRSVDWMGDEDRRLLRVIRDNARRMGRLIDDLLAFSRLGRSEIRRVPVDMRSLAESTWAEVAGASEGAPPEFTLGSIPHAEGDPEMLRLVWKNLLENAVKYSAGRPGRSVEAGFRDGPGGPAWYVRDNGVGFDMKYAGKLFGVFQRLHADPAFPGTGVGLAIVHRVVTRHGGRVWAEGVPGEGATFYFSLPGDSDA